MTPTRSKPSISIVRATDAHSDAVAEFYRQVWDPGATAAGVRGGRSAEALANPAIRDGEDIPTYLLLSDGEVLGYVSTIPVRVWLPAIGSEIDAAWVKGLMVLPSHRNGPIGVLVAKELVKHHPVLLSLTVQTNAQRLFTALGFAQSGALSTAMRILDPTAILRSIDFGALGLSGVGNTAKRGIHWVQKLGLAPAAGLVARGGFAIRSAFGPAGSKLRATIGRDPDGESLDQLWRHARPATRAAVVRDAAYLNFRYRGAERDAYTPVSAHRKDGTLAGVAYVREPRGEADPRLRGIRIATLSDLVYHEAEPEVGAALVRAAERCAMRTGAHAIISSASVPGLAATLRSRAWIGIPGTFHFSTHDIVGDSRFPQSLDDWWLTRGDGGSDGGL
jgi:hypothetical protein